MDFEFKTDYVENLELTLYKEGDIELISDTTVALDRVGVIKLIDILIKHCNDTYKE